VDGPLLTFSVHLTERKLFKFQFPEPSNHNYNFYKDSNITEAIACVDVVKRLKKRVHNELEKWPEHAVLNDVSFSHNFLFVP
jgi:midasin